MSDDQKGDFRRPPKDGQFRPGFSGHPQGRPKGTRNLRTDLAQLMKRMISVHEGGKAKRISGQQAMLLSLFGKALHGDVRAAKNLMDVILKLNLVPNSDAPVDDTLAESDKAIIAEFLRRNQSTTS